MPLENGDDRHSNFQKTKLVGINFSNQNQTFSFNLGKEFFRRTIAKRFNRTLFYSSSEPYPVILSYEFNSAPTSHT